MSEFPVHSGTDSTGNNLTGAFNLLTKNRQILLLKTIEAGLSSSPPRTQATFDNVLLAYLSLTRVVDSAAEGSLTVQDLLELESDVRNAGGVISPGLHSDGSRSLSSFREATFEFISIRFSPDVAKSIFSALNSYLRSLKPSDIGDVFRLIRAFLSPLLLEAGQSIAYDRFASFSDNQKTLVFGTIQDSIESNPTRPEGTVFEAVVCAYHSLNSLLTNARNGSISSNLVDDLVAAVSSAGGKILPSIYARGDISVAAFKRSTFEYLAETYEQMVCDAVLSSLNLRLTGTTFATLDSFIVLVETILGPLLPRQQDFDSSKIFRSLDANRQVLVFSTLDLCIANHPDRIEDAFGSVASAFFLERNFLESCVNGLFDLDILKELRQSIIRCGGVLTNGLVAEGPESVGSFYDDIVLPLKRVLPSDVFSALISALNAQLRQRPPSSVQDFLSIASAFLAPFKQHGISQDNSNNTRYLASVYPENTLRSPLHNVTTSHSMEDTSDLPELFSDESDVSIASSFDLSHLQPESLGIENQSSPQTLSQPSEVVEQPVDSDIDTVPTDSAAQYTESIDDAYQEDFHCTEADDPNYNNSFTQPDTFLYLDSSESLNSSQPDESPEDQDQGFQKKN